MIGSAVVSIGLVNLDVNRLHIMINVPSSQFGIHGKTSFPLQHIDSVVSGACLCHDDDQFYDTLKMLRLYKEPRVVPQCILDGLN